MRLVIEASNFFYYYYLYAYLRNRSYLHAVLIRLGCNIALIVFLVLFVEMFNSFILQMSNWLVVFLVSLDLFYKQYEYFIVHTRFALKSTYSCFTMGCQLFIPFLILLAQFLVLFLFKDFGIII